LSPNRPTLDLPAIRAQIPALQQQVHGKPLVYLDNGATALKPQPVLDAMLGYYAGCCANVHRAVHSLSAEATAQLEQARRDVAGHLGVADDAEIVFTRGTTESINLVAQTWARRKLGPSDEIVVTGMEHHSNIVPWQLLAAETGVTLRVIPFDDDGVLDLDAAAAIIGPRTRLLSVVAVSNALGTLNPVRALADLAHAHGAYVLVDGAQAVPHGPVDVAALGADFFAFSGHKVYGPTGIGVLWGRREALEACETWHGGGDMIRHVSFEGTTYADLPARLEAGTPHIAGAIGLGAGLRWMQGLGLEAIAAHEAALLAHGTALLESTPGVRLVGRAPRKAGVLSFVVDGVHPNDVGTLLDSYGVAVRTGHHCAEPAMRRLGVNGTIRASLAVYNTREDLDIFADALQRALRLLA
jgi:cysteine desulfurase/selenocysteine lyase